jgi:hypothetical protein
VGGIDLILQLSGLSSPQSAASSPLGFVFGVAFTLIFLWLILKRHNWARIVFAVLTLVTIVATAPTLSTELSVDVIGAILTVIQVVLQACSVMLLFRPPANAWFRAQAPA